MIGRTIGAITVATAMLATPASAFDDLLRIAGALPAPMQTPHLFDYTAPLDGFSPTSATQYGPSDTALGAALFAKANPDAVTGVDFSAVRGVLSFGEPPATVTVMFGEPGFGDGTAAALAGRGFEQSVIDDVPVFAQGDDYAIDLSRAGDSDPFGSSMGKAQRLGIGWDYLVRTAGWPEMRTTLGQLGRTGLDAMLWRAMLEGVAASTGTDSHLDIASAWSGSAFLGASADMSASPGAKAKIKRPSGGSYLLVTVALFAVTQDADHASLHIAMPFPDRGEAEASATIIAERLILQPFTPHRPRVDIHISDPYAIAVLSLDLPVTEAARAREIYASWMSDIYQRRFYPLDPGF